MTRFKNIVLGGEFAISYKIGALALPIIIGTVPLTSMAEDSSGTFLDWTLAAVCGTFFAIVCLLIVDKTFWANRNVKPVKNGNLFLLGALIGAIKGITTEITAQRIFHVTGINLFTILERSLSSASIGAISIPLIALLGFSLDAHKKIREKRLNELAGIEDLLEGLGKAEIEEGFLRDTKVRIAEARQQFIANFIEVRTHTTEEISAELSAIANQLVRPLSHRAEQLNKKSILERHTWQESVMRFPSAVKLGIPWLIGLFISSSARVQLQIRGLHGGLAMLSLSCLIFWFCLHLFAWVNRNERNSNKRLFFSFALTMILNSTLSWIGSELLFGNYKVNFTLNVFWCAIIVIVVGISTLYLTYELEELEELEAEYSKKYQELLKLEQGRPRISASLARYLHGTMQTRLIASAYRINNLGNDASESDLTVELNMVLEHLKLPIDLAVLEEKKPPQEMFKEIVDLWSPFMEISFKFPHSELLGSKVTSSICEVVNEALSNAFRHGKATNVCIETEVFTKKCKIVISDNGLNYHESAPGLGMTIFDQVSTSWKLERHGNSTILEANFAF